MNNNLNAKLAEHNAHAALRAGSIGGALQDGSFGSQIGQAMTQPAPAPEVHELVAGLFGHSELLSESLARLENRLAPVLASYPASDTKRERLAANCMLGDQLIQLDIRLGLMIEAVEMLHSRLQV